MSRRGWLGVGVGLAFAGAVWYGLKAPVAPPPGHLALSGISPDNQFADLLNDPSTSVYASDAIHHVGESLKVCGVVASAAYARRTHGQPTFLNLDQAYPDHVFTAVIWGKDRDKFEMAPEFYLNSIVCISGVVTLYKGRAEIIVSDPAQIDEVSFPQ